MIDHLAAVQLAVHGGGLPQGRSVEQLGIEIHIGDKNSGTMSRQAADDQAIGRTAKLPQQDGRAVLLLALIQK